MDTSLATSGFRPDEREYYADGLRLVYVIRGSGPLVVALVPGWGIGSTYLTTGFAALETRFTVIYVEPRGNGRSARPDDAAFMGNRDMADDLEHLRAHLGVDSMTLIGHSASGGVAMNYAARYPTCVEKLLLIDSVLPGFDDSQTFSRFAAARMHDPRYQTALASLQSMNPRNDAEFADAFNAVLPYYFYDPERHLAEFAATLTAPPSLWASQAYCAAERKVAGQVDLSAIRADTLVAVGRDDPFCSERAATEIATRIAGSSLFVFDHCGHFPWIECRETFFEVVVPFLLGRDAGRPL